MGPLTARQIHDLAVKLMCQYGDVDAIERSTKTLQAVYGRKFFPQILEAAKNLHPSELRRIQATREKATKKGWNSATAPKLFLNNKQIDPFWPIPAIVDALLKKYGSEYNIFKQEALMKRVFGPLRYGLIIKEMESQKEKAEHSVVSSMASEDTPSAAPIIVMLKIEGTVEHHGQSCYKVRYAPDGNDPYDWFIPVVSKLPEGTEYIRCCYKDHKLSIVDNWVIKKRYPTGSKRELTVLSSKKTKHTYRYRLRDEVGDEYECVDSIEIPLRAIVECQVKGYNDKASPNNYLKLKVLGYRERPIPKRPNSSTASSRPKEVIPVFNQTR